MTFILAGSLQETTHYILWGLVLSGHNISCQLQTLAVLCLDTLHVLLYIALDTSMHT